MTNESDTWGTQNKIRRASVVREMTTLTPPTTMFAHFALELNDLLCPEITAVLGTMSIPDPLNATDAKEALDYFLAAGFDKIDTAILYQGGATEATLGEGAATRSAL